MTPDGQDTATPTRRPALRRTAGPVSFFFGPVYYRETASSTRKRMTYTGRALFAMLMGLILFLTVFNLLFYQTQSTLRTALDMQHAAPVLIGAIASIQFLVLPLVTLSIAAPSICDERLRRTLPSLMTTPLSAIQIVFNKFTAAIGEIVLLIAMAVPVLLAVRVLGGIPLEGIIAVTCITISTCVLVAGAGLLASAISHRPAAASSVGLGLALFIVLAPILLFNILPDLEDVYGYTEELTSQLSAPVAFITVSSVLMGFETPEEGITRVWIVNTLINTAIGVLLLLAASYRMRQILSRESVPVVRRSPLDLITRLVPGTGGRRRDTATRPSPAPPPPPQPDTPITADTPDPADAAAAPDSPTPAAPQESPATSPVIKGRSREVSQAPVFWRETRQPWLRTRRRTLTALVSLLLVIAFIYWRADPYDQDMQQMTLFFGLLILIFTVATRPAQAIALEREARTWESLIATPLTPTGIILGKWMGAMWAHRYFVGLLFAHLIVSVYVLEMIRPILLLHAVLITISIVAMLSATGMLLSLLCKKSTTAAVSNFGVAAVMWALPFPVIAACYPILSGAMIDRLLTAAAAGNPVGLAVMSSEINVARGPSVFPNNTANLFNRTIDNTQLTWITVGTTSMCVMIAAGSLLVAIMAFSRFAPRAS